MKKQVNKGLFFKRLCFSIQVDLQILIALDNFQS